MDTPPPLATPADLAMRVAEPIADDDQQALYFLAYASSIVRAYVGADWTNEAGTELLNVPAEAHNVTIEVAARVWLNPSGNTQETVGPFTERRPELFADGFFLTGTEKSQLAKYRPSSFGGLFTITTTKGDGFDPTIYVSVSPQPGEPIPYYERGTPGVQGY